MRILIIGRWQPFHNGHLHLVKEAASRCDEVVLVIGSSQKSHSDINPYTASERIEMIHDCLRAEKINNCMIMPLTDLDNSSLWVSWIESQCPKFDLAITGNRWTARLLRENGHKVEEPKFYKADVYNGTIIRQNIISEKKWEHLVPKTVADHIKKIDGANRIKDVSDVKDFKTSCGPL